MSHCRRISYLLLLTGPDFDCIIFPKYLLWLFVLFGFSTSGQYETMLSDIISSG